ncbi:hypothetical protein QFC19_001088 [Naganishia cerealis]|uniref:Uncharacterized protein n=1 Tax=Naganishia cerealis TaxID=610337 RepID=A0ACC2WJA9_9TREE|nr:hypothetical protein QFC19_001088 [Naganishia cerealis]
MPREDYASPALYSLRVLGTLVRYLVGGGVLLGVVSLGGLEAAHQYVERSLLAAPAHLDLVAPADADYYAWAEENDSWTGGAAGGTSPHLGFYARHALRAAWVCQTWGRGISGATITRAAGDLGGGSGQVMKGMIGSAERARTDRAAAALSAGVNLVDPGYEMAEAYIASAITHAKKRGIIFPEELSVNRETYPTSEQPHSPEPSPIAIDILLRHAEIYERIATPSALHKSQQLYERVLRSVVPYTTLPPLPTTTGLEREAFVHAVRESQVLRLAKKIGDVAARTGDDVTAHGWWTWGLARVGIVPHASDSLAAAMTTPQSPEIKVDGRANDVSWFGPWFSSPAAAAGKATPSANMTLVARAPTISPPSPASYANIPPPLQRSVIALLDAYSTHLAITGDLSSAHVYQTIGLDITSAALASRPPVLAAAAAAALHSLWLEQRAALFTLHKAEVEYASRRPAKGTSPDVVVVEETLGLLGEANGRAEKVIKELTAGPSPAATGLDSTRIVPSLDPHRGITMKTLPLSTAFTSPAAAEKAPAQQLLKDAQRTAAEGWNITGLLYESLARRPASTSTNSPNQSQRQELEELAMDSYERAIGWNKIALGGQVTGHHDVVQDGEDVVGPTTAAAANGAASKTREYWGNYARVKARLGSATGAEAVDR